MTNETSGQDGPAEIATGEVGASSDECGPTAPSFISPQDFYTEMVGRADVRAILRRLAE